MSSKPVPRYLAEQHVGQTRTVPAAALAATTMTRRGEEELATFEVAALDEVAVHLAPATVAGYLLNMARDAEALGCCLRGAGEAGGDAALVEQAHRIAGSAGFLGFGSIVAAARAYEAAFDATATGKARYAADLAEALEASLPIMRQQFARFTAMAAADC